MNESSEMASEEEEAPRAHVPSPVEAYCAKLTTKLLPIQEELYRSTGASGWSVIASGADVITFVSQLMRLIGATRVLDVGTFTGVSALAAALTVPDDGKVISMDISSEDYDKYGKEVISRSGVSHKIDFVVKPAKETLDDLLEKGQAGTFDFAFIDAYKDEYPDYYRKCLKLMRRNGIMVFDNALFGGQVVNDETEDTWVKALRETNQMAFDDATVDSSLLNVGDGILVVIKK